MLILCRLVMISEGLLPATPPLPGDMRVERGAHNPRLRRRVLGHLPPGTLRNKARILEEALTGHFGDHHGFLCQMMLDRIDGLSAQIGQLDARVEQAGSRSPVACRPVTTAGRTAIQD